MVNLPRSRQASVGPSPGGSLPVPFRMTAHELQTRLRFAHPPALLHVLPPEVFAAARLPGSANACSYETAFLDHVKALGLDPCAPVIVHGAGEGSLDAATAGFTSVQPFEGGLAA